MHIDPILTIACAIAIAVILANAATHKLRAPALFAKQLNDYQLLPRSVIKPIARSLPFIEIALAFAVLAPVTRGGAALASATLLALYAAAIGVNLWRGRADIDCGCNGPGQLQPLRSALLVRNAILVALALIAGVVPLERTAGLFDGFVSITAAAVALLIYAASEGLLANGPRLMKLIGR